MLLAWVCVLGIPAFVAYEPPQPPNINEEAVLPDLVVRANSLQIKAREVEEVLLDSILPLYKDINSTNRVVRKENAFLVAASVYKHTRNRNINPYFVNRVIKVENPWLIPDTTSYAGAVGMMQIMPFWANEFEECGSDLTNIDTNICVGVSIWSRYMDRALTSAVSRALLNYNGCVSTPGCESYIDKVIGDMDLQNVFN